MISDEENEEANVLIKDSIIIVEDNDLMLIKDSNESDIYWLIEKDGDKKVIHSRIEGLTPDKFKEFLKQLNKYMN